jgi:hypothetical protein
VVFLLDQQVIVSLVDDGQVELLGADQVRLGQGEVVISLKDLDDTAVVETRSESSQEVGKQVGLVEVSFPPSPEFGAAHLVTDVEGNSLVGNFHVGDLNDDLLELRVVPITEALHHGESSIVGLI